MKVWQLAGLAGIGLLAGCADDGYSGYGGPGPYAGPAYRPGPAYAVPAYPPPAYYPAPGYGYAPPPPPPPRGWADGRRWDDRRPPGPDGYDRAVRESYDNNPNLRRQQELVNQQLRAQQGDQRAAEAQQRRQAAAAAMAQQQRNQAVNQVYRDNPDLRRQQELVNQQLRAQQGQQ